MRWTCRSPLSARHDYDRKISSITSGRRTGIEKKEHATLYASSGRESVYERERERDGTYRQRG